MLDLDEKDIKGVLGNYHPDFKMIHYGEWVVDYMSEHLNGRIVKHTSTGEFFELLGVIRYGNYNQGYEVDVYNAKLVKVEKREVVELKWVEVRDE